MKMNRRAYEKLIDENIKWLLEQPRTLERLHIEQVLRSSSGHEYNDELATKDKQIEAVREASDRLLVLATKHCPIEHRDFEEIKALAQLDGGEG